MAIGYNKSMGAEATGSRFVGNRRHLIESGRTRRTLKDGSSPDTSGMSLSEIHQLLRNTGIRAIQQIRALEEPSRNEPGLHLPATLALYEYTWGELEAMRSATLPTPTHELQPTIKPDEPQVFSQPQVVFGESKVSEEQEDIRDLGDLSLELLEILKVFDPSSPTVEISTDNRRRGLRPFEFANSYRMSLIAELPREEKRRLAKEIEAEDDGKIFRRNLDSSDERIVGFSEPAREIINRFSRVKRKILIEFYIGRRTYQDMLTDVKKEQPQSHRKTITAEYAEDQHDIALIFLAVKLNLVSIEEIEEILNPH